MSDTNEALVDLVTVIAVAIDRRVDLAIRGGATAFADSVDGDNLFHVNQSIAPAKRR